MKEKVQKSTEGNVADRRSVLAQIERAWASQTRRPTAKEVESWIKVGRGRRMENVLRAMRRDRAKSKQAR